MPYIADFHVHSKYSRATSKEMEIASLAKWAKIKGIAMLGTGDFTHPLWLAELKKHLRQREYGVYEHGGISFLLTTEVSNIYFKAGRTRKVHNIIFAPSLEVVEEINGALAEHGALDSDGRPILGLDCTKMAKTLSAIAPDIFIVPAHAWTPHFSIFGSNSGFDSAEECFEDQLPKVISIETGLSSDPKMNWRWSKLDRFCLISNSDAHSPAKIGREANVFSDRINYKDLITILKTKDAKRFLYTIEFFPEEGKYHWDGHRACKTRLSPEESVKTKDICPVCGRKVTVGVMHRVEGLADRPESFVDSKSPSFKNVVPLAEIMADAFGVSADSVRVEREYQQLIKNFGTEFAILLDLEEEELRSKCPASVTKGVMNMRKGSVTIVPGYDGEYGRVSVFKEGEAGSEKQLSFF